MSLQKQAPFGVLPGPVTRKQSALPIKLGAIASQLKIIANATIPGAPPGGVGAGAVPSPTAFKIIACLGQVRDALCAQARPSRKSVNEQLVNAMASNSAQAAHKLLTARHGALVADFEQQFRPLDAAGKLEQQRRERWHELAVFESKLAAGVK